MRIKLVFLVVLAFALLGIAQAQPASESHSFSVHDMLAMDRIGDPHVSPDNKWVVHFR